MYVVRIVVVVHTISCSSINSSTSISISTGSITVGWRDTPQQRRFPKEIKFLQSTDKDRWRGFVFALHTHTTTPTDDDVKFIGHIPLLAQHVVFRRLLIRGQFQNGFDGRGQSVFVSREEKTENRKQRVEGNVS